MGTISCLYSKYFQKSRVFLYPLLDMVKGRDLPPTETYINWRNKTKPEDCILTCIYLNDNTPRFSMFVNNVILKHPRFKSKEVIDNLVICNYDLSNNAKDWDNFLNGKYSKLEYRTKIKILKYFGNSDSNSVYIDSFLNPHKYYGIYSRLLNIDIENLKSVVELCDKPDIEKETFNSDILIFKS